MDNWGGPVGTDSELRQGDFQVLFKLVRGAVAQGVVAAVEVKVSVGVVGHFQPGFFERGEGRAVGQRFDFERAPTGFGLGVVAGVTQSTEVGHGVGPLDADAAGGASVLAAAVGVNDEPRRGLARG